MKTFIRFCIGLTYLLVSGTVTLAAKPPLIPAWHNDEIVFFTVVNENVEGVEREGIHDHVAEHLYAFGPPGDQPQFDVLSTAPGERSYNPWWEVIMVIVLDERDVQTEPFTSEDEILEAEEAGEVMLVDTEFVFLCQVLPSRKE